MTIHQPSTKVYNDFDQVMLLSRGQQAFMGKAESAHRYFERIGYPMMQMTNPAGFLVDLVNTDFTSEDSLISILDEWKQYTAKNKANKVQRSSVDSDDDDFHQLMKRKKNVVHELITLFRRHALLIVRDPFLYVGRIVVMLVSTMIFALAYWNSRDKIQSRAINFYYANCWTISLGSMFAVVAVFTLNAEFRSVFREVKNGMIHPLTYVTAKSILVLPVMLLFAIASLSVGVYAIIGIKANYAIYMFLFAISVFIFECIAEVLSVAFFNPLIGMLCFLAYWFTAFLFGGMFLPVDDLPIVIRWIYYVMPLSHTFDAFAYHTFSGEDWPSCTPDANSGAVCIDFSQYPGEDPSALILNVLSKSIPNVTGEDNRVLAMGVVLGMELGYKVLYCIIVLYKCSQSTTLKEPTLDSSERSDVEVHQES